MKWISRFTFLKGFLLGFYTSLLFLPYSTQASNLICNPNTQGCRITQPTFGPNLNGAVAWLESRAFTIIFTVLAVLSVILIVWSGIQYISAAGNPEQAKKARQSIINIVLGVILVACLYYAVRLILGIAGLVAPGTIS